ncbi:MAG: hypothetical protein V7784_08970 [Oceanospirillaceae bacterium]
MFPLNVLGISKEQKQKQKQLINFSDNLNAIASPMKARGQLK